MTNPSIEEVRVFCDYLATRRKALLAAWRKATGTDPGQPTAHSLTRRQFNDHIPEVLDAFDRKLRAHPGGKQDKAADIEKKEEEVKHGLHRWQQGYRLQELVHEWGHLHLCLVAELEAFAVIHPECDRRLLAQINRKFITLIHEAMGESAVQYERMQQAEAAGHLIQLRKALSSINEIELRRASLIHQAVHDLRNDVLGFSLVANAMGRSSTTETNREEFATMLAQGIQGLQAMLGELMELARLEAGQEVREITTFDASALVTELGNVSQLIAQERSLYLKVKGPAKLSIEGDAGKVRRLLQNLLMNALKYTEHGGVTISWGEEAKSWWVKVHDTGPGILAGPRDTMVVGLTEATASARESDEKGAASDGDISHVLTPSSGNQTTSSANQKPGEGIGLSIVKRLCELLDASLEMVSSVESGTTFRVVLPRFY